ncbi:MAG: insulinase family protein [Deltaproteobacteria bacterium]|nr:insulinase family protein [Deltaproteobacteria bacterium]
MAQPDMAALNRDRPATARIEALGELVHGAARVGRFRLGNGLRVLIWEDRRAPVFSYQTWFAVGSRVEVAGKSGIAHLFEHLMFKATRNLAEGEFDAIMERRGAETNAATWVDWTYYKEKLPSGDGNLELCCKLEADRMENMILDAHQLESEREVVINERLLRVDNDPDGRLFEALYRLAYQEHPYGVPTIGWMEDIRAISLEDCLTFYERYYAPNSAAVVIVGDVDTIDALQLIQKYYGHLEAQELPAESLGVEPAQTAERRESFDLPISSEKGLYAWHGMAGNDPEQAALEVLDEVLTGGESARLHERLVTETELASQVGGMAVAWRHPGLYELAITMRPGRALAEAEAILDEELARLRDEGPTERELEKAKNGLEAAFLREIASTGSRARGLGDAEVTFEDASFFFEQMPRLAAVTAEDVKRVARRVLRDDNRTVVIGRPRPEEAAA